MLKDQYKLPVIELSENELSVLLNDQDMLLIHDITESCVN